MTEPEYLEPPQISASMRAIIAELQEAIYRETGIRDAQTVGPFGEPIENLARSIELERAHRPLFQTQP